VLSLFSLVLSFDFFARNKETKESTSINYLKAGFPNLRFENDIDTNNKYYVIKPHRPSGQSFELNFNLLVDVHLHYIYYTTIVD